MINSTAKEASNRRSRLIVYSVGITIGLVLAIVGWLTYSVKYADLKAYRNAAPCLAQPTPDCIEHLNAVITDKSEQEHCASAGQDGTFCHLEIKLRLQAKNHADVWVTLKRYGGPLTPAYIPTDIGQHVTANVWRGQVLRLQAGDMVDQSIDDPLRLPLLYSWFLLSLGSVLF